MRSLAIFSILAPVVLFLGPLLSNASPLPPNPHKDCQSRHDVCNQLAGNTPSTISAEGFQRAAQCHEANFSTDLTEGRIEPHRKDCAQKSGKLALEMWFSRAKLLFSKDVMFMEIMRLRVSRSYMKLTNFKDLREGYIRQYVAWIDRALAFDKIITEFANGIGVQDPSNVLIAKMFDDREVTKDTKELETFYDLWTAKFIHEVDIHGNIEGYTKALAVDFHTLLRQFRAHWEGEPIDKIESNAKEGENSARQGHSEAHMTESLLLRYIRVRKESKPTHELLDQEIKRLKGVDKDSEKWERLKGLTGWLRLEYENYQRKL